MSFAYAKTTPSILRDLRLLIIPVFTNFLERAAVCVKVCRLNDIDLPQLIPILQKKGTDETDETYAE
ncbi:MAG: hypothetical protein ACTS3T_23095, partial [Almyronema sp.]